MYSCIFLYLQLFRWKHEWSDTPHVTILAPHPGTKWQSRQCHLQVVPCPLYCSPLLNCSHPFHQFSFPSCIFHSSFSFSVASPTDVDIILFYLIRRIFFPELKELLFLKLIMCHQFVRRYVVRESLGILYRGKLPTLTSNITIATMSWSTSGSNGRMLKFDCFAE